MKTEEKVEYLFKRALSMDKELDNLAYFLWGIVTGMIFAVILVLIG